MKTLHTLIGICLVAATALATDIDGTWANRPGGGDILRTCSFKTTDEIVSMVCTGIIGDSEISAQGKLQGDEFTFIVIGGAPGAPTVTRYSAKFKESTLSLLSNNEGRLVSYVLYKPRADEALSNALREK